MSEERSDATLSVSAGGLRVSTLCGRISGSFNAEDIGEVRHFPKNEQCHEFIVINLLDREDKPFKIFLPREAFEKLIEKCSEAAAEIAS